MNILILDDESSSRIVARKLIRDTVNSVNDIYEAENFNSALSILLKNQVDVILVDISMPEGTGFDFLDKIDYNKYSVVFITAHVKYAVEAAKYRAFDYLLKPLNYKDIISVFNRIQLQSSSGNAIQPSTVVATDKDKVVIPHDSGHLVKQIEDITYIQASAHLSTIYLDDSTSITSTKSIGFFEKVLERSSFFRIHNSYLINLNKIGAYTKGALQVILTDGTNLPIAKRKKKQFVEALKKFY